MVKQVDIRENEEYITIKFSEYKELLITKGKYEELSKEKNTITWNPAPIQPLTTPYPIDLTPKYPYTLCKTECMHDDAIDSLKTMAGK